MHVGRVHRRVLQTVEEHRVVGPRASPDGHVAVRRAGRAAGPVADAGRRGHRSRLFPVQTPLGTAVGLEGCAERVDTAYFAYAGCLNNVRVL